MSGSVPHRYHSDFHWPQDITEIPGQEQLVVTTSNTSASDNPSSNVEPTADHPGAIPTSSSATADVMRENSSLLYSGSQLLHQQQINPIIQIQNVPANTQTNLSVPLRASSSPDDFSFAMDDVEGEDYTEDPNLLSPRAAPITPLLLRRSQPTASETTAMHPPAFSQQQSQRADSASSSRAPMPSSDSRLQTSRDIRDTLPPVVTSQRQLPAGNEPSGSLLTRNTPLLLGQIANLNLPPQSASHFLPYNTIHAQPRLAGHRRQESQESDHPPNLLYPGNRPTESLPGMVLHPNNYGTDLGVPLVGNINDPRWWYYDVGYIPRQPWMRPEVPLTNGHSNRYVGEQAMIARDREGGWRSAGDGSVGGGMTVGEPMPAGERAGNVYRSMRTEVGPSRESGTYRTDDTSAAQRTRGRGPPSNTSSEISPHTIRPATQRPLVEPQDETSLSRGREEGDRLTFRQLSLPRRDAVSAPSGVALVPTSLTQRIALTNSTHEDNTAQESPSAGPSTTGQANITSVEDADRGEVAIDEISSTTGRSPTAPLPETQSEPDTESQLPPTSSALEIPSARSPSGDSWETIISHEERTIPLPSQTQTIVEENPSLPEQAILQPIEAQTIPHTPTAASTNSPIHTRTQSQQQAYQQSSPQSRTSSSEPSARTPLLPSEAFGHRQSVPVLPLTHPDTNPNLIPERRRGLRWCECVGDFDMPTWVQILLLMLGVFMVVVLIWGLNIFESHLLEGDGGYGGYKRL